MKQSLSLPCPLGLLLFDVELDWCFSKLLSLCMGDFHTCVRLQSSVLAYSVRYMAWWDSRNTTFEPIYINQLYSQFPVL